MSIPIISLTPEGVVSMVGEVTGGQFDGKRVLVLSSGGGSRDIKWCVTREVAMKMKVVIESFLQEEEVVGDSES